MHLHSSIPTLATLTLDNFDPWWLWISVILGSILILALTYRGIYQRTGRRLTWILFLLRLTGVLAILVAIVKPAWVETSEHSERPSLAVVLDDSQSMSFPGASTTPDAQSSRYRAATHWLQDSADGKALRDKFDLTLLNINGDDITSAGPPAEPQGEQTDLLRPLQSAAGRLRGRGGSGVVLISDGRDTTGRDSFLAMREFPLPVYTIGFRQPPLSKSETPDLAIVGVDSPRKTIIKNSVPIRVTVSKSGGPAMDIPVHIERAGSPLASAPIHLPEGPTRQTVTVPYTPQEAGEFVLTARVDVLPGERVSTNNLALFRLRVEAEPLRVMVIEGVLRPEFQFLKDRLTSDPDIDLVTFVRAANPDQAGDSGRTAVRELLSPERLKKIDVILLGDFESDMLDGPTYGQLKTWVDSGGSIFVLGGYLNLGEQGLGKTALRDLLPVELDDASGRQIDQPFTFTLTPEGATHPAMSITGDVTRDKALWEGLPELKGIVATGRAKPAATVLARHPVGPPGAGPNEGYPVLAIQPFGKGTVALIAADTTWRWSRLTRMAGRPDALYVRFWAQLIRFLAKRDIQPDQSPLTVSTDSVSYDRGDRVSISVHRNVGAMIPGSSAANEALELVLTTPDDRHVPIAPVAGTDPTAWTASYFPDRGGRFRLDARLVASVPSTQPRAGSNDPTVANQTAEFLVRGSALELSDPTTNPTLLAQISSLTGGFYTDIDDSAGLTRMVESLPSAAHTYTETKRTSVWNSPWLISLFILCLTTEWIVRRRNRLA